MKKMLTKMLAVAMAWAMLLSCTVMASATEPNTPTGPNSQSGIGGEGQIARGWGVTDRTSAAGRASLQVSSSGYRNYASGEAKGVSHNEGRVPADVIRLLMPTVGKNALDMILDPNNLINETKGARYGSAGVSFSDSKVYFVNEVTSTGFVKYTNESQDLIITNKSSVPVNVNVSLRANKGSGPDDGEFKFVPSTGKLVDSGGAQMYLAIVSSDNQEKALSSGQLDEMHQFDMNSVNYRFIPLSSGTITGDGGTFVVSGGATSSGTFQFLTDDKNIQAALLGDDMPTVKLEVIVGSNGTESWDEAYPNGMGIAVYSNGNILKITAQGTDPYYPVIKPDYLTAYNDGSALEEQFDDVRSIGYILNATKEVPVSVWIYNNAVVGAEESLAEFAEADPVAVMYFNVKAVDLRTLTKGHAVTLKPVSSDGDKMLNGATVMLSSGIPAAQNAYVTAYDSVAGYYKSFVEEDLANFNKFGGVGSQGEYSDLKFHLKAVLGGGKGSWDTIGGDITLDLIWDVYAADGDANAQPTVKVTNPATAASGTGAATKATITWTAGTGEYADYEPYNVVYGSNKTMTITKTSANEFTITATSTTKAGKNDAKVVFKATGKNDIQVALPGWYTGT